MAAHETRMLLLGAVALFEPVNGYQIRRELVSWQVQEWASLKPGSIYHGLSTLSRQGHVTRYDLIDAGRDVAVYELTGTGRAELERLLAISLETVHLYDQVAFHAAFSLMPLITRPRAIGHLDTRLGELDATIEQLSKVLRDARDGAPPHAMLGLDLQLARTRAERAWLVETLDDVRSGRLTFRDEAWTWSPPEDDPGWQMEEDRKRYRELLGH